VFASKWWIYTNPVMERLIIDLEMQLRT